MKKSLSNKQRYIIAGAIAFWGFVFIGSGVTMTMMDTPVKETKTEFKVVQKRVSNMKSNEIRLKTMEQEINQPISVNIKDYLENANDIEDKIINQLKLDTSMVNVNQAGTYTYTITYKKKTFNGTFTIKEKPLPNMVLTLKNLNLELGSTLSTDIQNYVNEPLTDEVKKNISLDLSKVNTAQAANYQYTVTYNGRLYTGTITIFAPQKVEETKPTTPTTEEECIKANGTWDSTKTPSCTLPEKK